MAFVVVYDACVLYPARLRDLLIRIARIGIARARWTDEILDECFRSILENRPDLDESALRRTRELMIKAVPDCMVTGYEDLIEGLTLPDQDDRHVLAAPSAPARRRSSRSTSTTSHRMFLVPSASRPSTPTTLYSTQSTSRQAR